MRKVGARRGAHAPTHKGVDAVDTKVNLVRLRSNIVLVRNTMG